ncbi:uncharacterized protein LOC132897207 isoform X3 [Neoarius graeffei]|nr:uncharacterized protein LOC132897207 isoform X3 [Neoarius graeffei]
MYLIVVFEDNNQTSPVAKEWFSGGLAWWPPYKDQFQILRAVQKRVMPDPAKGWRQFRAHVLYESDSIQTIQSKWDKACITSDLNTDVEMQENPVREHKRPRRLRESSLSEEEDDPEHLRRPPPLPLKIARPREEPTYTELSTVTCLSDMEAEGPLHHTDQQQTCLTEIPRRPQTCLTEIPWRPQTCLPQTHQLIPATCTDLQVGCHWWNHCKKDGLEDMPKSVLKPTCHTTKLVWERK